MRNFVKAATAATVLLAGVPLAHAADMSLPPVYQPESEPMVEFGSGWYLRGDIGYSTISAPMGSPPVEVLGNSPNGQNLYAPASASSILNNRTFNFGDFGASAGVGYQFNRWFRMDATYDWRQNNSTNITSYNANCAIDVPAVGSTAGYVDYNNPACYVIDKVKTQSWTGLVNVYGDLGTWFRVTPYLGGGVGVTHIQATANEMYYWNDGLGNYGGAGVNSYKSTVANAIISYGYPGNVGPTQIRNNFSFALMAGIAYEIAPHLKLDVGYRYLNMGSLSVETNAGATVRKTIDAQEVRAGLRWTPDL
jgi:opacity protein-like surface antigen